MNKMKFLVLLVLMVCTCLSVFGEPPGTRVVVILDVFPGTEGKEAFYITAAPNNPDIVGVTVAQAGSSKESDRFHITLDLKKMGSTVVRIIANRGGYHMQIRLLPVTVTDTGPSIESPNISMRLEKVSKRVVSNFQYNIFNLLFDDGKTIKIPYRE